MGPLANPVIFCRWDVPPVTFMFVVGAGAVSYLHVALSSVETFSVTEAPVVEPDVGFRIVITGACVSIRNVLVDELPVLFAVSVHVTFHE